MQLCIRRPVPIPVSYTQLYRDDWTLDGYAGDADAGSNDAAGQVADAAPHFTSAQIKSIYEKLSNAYDDFSLQKLTYEEVRDAYFDGVDGTLDYEGNATTCLLYTSQCSFFCKGRRRRW